MSNKIVRSFVNTPLTLLLILLIILILFCIMKFKLYDYQTIFFDDEDQNIQIHEINEKNNIKINEIDKMDKIKKIYDKHNKNKIHNNNDLDYIFSKNNSENNSEEISEKINKYIIILNDIIKKSELKLKEQFDDVSIEDLNDNMINLKTLAEKVNNYDSNLQEAQNAMNNINSQKLLHKDIFQQLLTDIYTYRNLERINKQNAIAYREYSKYTTPKQNMYYKQYM